MHSTIGLEFWQLVVLVSLRGLLDAPDGTARTALLPDVATRAGWSYERATGATAVVERASRLAGAPFAGLLIAVTGPTNVLWIDAATFRPERSRSGFRGPRPSASALGPRTWGISGRDTASCAATARWAPSCSS